jgi:hypothetical protein
MTAPHYKYIIVLTDMKPHTKYYCDYPSNLKFLSGMFIQRSNADVRYKTNNVQNVNSNSDKIESGSENEIRKNFPNSFARIHYKK